MPRRKKTYHKKGVKRAKADEVIQEALEGLRSGRFKNASDAAQKLNCPKQRLTIWRRWTGRTKPPTIAHSEQQLLSPEQENVLVAWAQFLGMQGTPLTKRTIAPKIESLCGQKPCRNWIYRFLRRHPECTMGRPAGLDPKRAQSFNFPTVNAYFEKLQKVMDEHNIPWENVYNMDEIGIQLGGGRSGNGEVYIFSSADKSRYLQKSDDLELITVIESVCADGSSPVKPCFVFAGSSDSMCEDWFDAEDDILVATTPNGWTSESVFKDWFETCFVKGAQAHGDPSKPILLLFDGHSSHESVEVIDIADKKKIILFELPPHTTHRLQPCDVGVFSPLKREWQKQAQAEFERTGIPLEVKDVVRVYMRARSEAFKQATIRKAFTKSGLVLDESGTKIHCDINQFTANDFAPSIPTSTTLRLPHGFPGGDSENALELAPGATSSQPPQETQVAAPITQDAEVITGRTPPPPSRAPSPNPFLCDPPSVGSSTPLSQSPPSDLAVSSTNWAYDDDTEDTNLTPRSLARKYKDRCNQLTSQCRTFEAHAILARHALTDITRKLNAKKTRRTNNRNVTVGGRVITTQEGRALALQQRQARIEKQRKAEELKQKRLDAVCEQRQRRQTLGREGMFFKGALTIQKLSSLVDIAWCMGLTENGTREQLIKRITTHVDTHPEIRNDQRFAGLWRRAARRSQQENTAVAPSSVDHMSQGVHVADISDAPMVLYDVDAADDEEDEEDDDDDNSVMAASDFSSLQVPQ